MLEIVARRFGRGLAAGSLGVVTDTRYVCCYWPKLDRPTALFAAGSRGLEVMGRPTPRNVVFPGDTVFLDYVPDALFAAETAALDFLRRSRGPGAASFVNLTLRAAQVWRAAYDAAVAALPPTATRIATRPDCHFLRHREEIGRKPVVIAGRADWKILTEEYVAELAPAEVADLLAGRASEAALREGKTFVSLVDPARTLRPAPAEPVKGR